MEALLKVTWQKLLYLTASVLTPWEGWGGEGQKNKKTMSPECMCAIHFTSILSDFIKIVTCK